MITKLFRVGDLFNIHPTKTYKMTNRDLLSPIGKVPVIANTSLNNGICGYSIYAATEKGGIITFSDTTTADAIFYQPNDFIGYSHVQGMYPKSNKWNDLSLRYFLTVFKKNALSIGFSYANKFNRKIASNMEVLLPVKENNEIDYDYMCNYIKRIDSKIEDYYLNILKNNGLYKLQKTNINISKNTLFKEFKVEEIFKVDSSKHIFHANTVKIYDIEIEGTYQYVVRATTNNGVRGYIKANSSEINMGNTISFAQDTFTVFYHEKPYTTGNKVKILTSKYDGFNENIANYIIAAFNKSLEQYSWGIGSDVQMIKSFKIYLPTKDGKSPDYDYMDNYIKIIKHQLTECLNTN